VAPATTVISRMTQTAATVFTALGLPDEFITHETTEMGTHQLTKTANRSVLGTMNDFAYLAEAQPTAKNPTDLLELSLRLARTPCGPLYRSNVSPDRGPSTLVPARGSIVQAPQPIEPAPDKRPWQGAIAVRADVSCRRRSVATAIRRFSPG